MSGTASLIARTTEQVVVAVERRVDAALEADLDGAALPRLLDAADDLVERREVGGAAQVLGELALRERAEAALEVADVRVLDVPRDDVRDVSPFTSRRRRSAAAKTRSRSSPRARNRRTISSSPSSSRVSTGNASRGTNGTGTLGARRPLALAGETDRVGRRAARAASPPGRSTRRRRTPGRRGAAPRARGPPRASPPQSRSSSGHGASGLTWSIVTGDTPPQSLMPASSSRGKSS